MHDPLVVAFEIRRPWPRHDAWKTKAAAKQGIRWKAGGAFWVVAGRGLYFPPLITVWHRDPSDYDSTTCPTRGRAWRFHVHHWRLQVPALQALRRRLLTRCAWCGGRSVKGDRVNVSHSWHGSRGHWWQGEPGLYHRDCSTIRTAHATCVCEDPVLEHDGYGRCARCNRARGYGTKPETINRLRELSEIPRGARTAPDFDVEVD